MGAMRDLWLAVSGPFRRRRPVRERRELVIPDEEVGYIVKLFDMARFGERLAEGKYLLWQQIGRLYPETRRGSWSIDCSDVRRVVVREEIES